MTTLTGFTRPSDPINMLDMASHISSITGKTVTVDVTATDVQVTGSTISGADTAAIQSAMSSYYFSYFQYGAPLTDNPNMSADRHDKGVTEHAAYWADNALATLISAKPAVRYWENGTFKNGTAVTGDIIVFTDSVTTSGGSAIFYPTSTHLSTGTALCSYISADSFQPNYRDNTGVYAPGTVTVAGNLKSVAIALTKQSFTGVVVLAINVLGSASMAAIPDSVVVKSTFWGIAA